MKSNFYLLRKLVQVYLNEADAYTKKFGKRFDQSAEVKSYVGVVENEIVKYAVRMTDTPKLGINPGYSFDNPRGIYAYPLISQIYDDLVNDELPYVSKARNFVIFEIKDAKKWLDVGSNIKYKNWKDICNVMLQHANSTFNKDILFEDVLDEAKKGLHWSISNGAKIYDFGYALTKFFPENKMSSIWQSILLNAGFEGVYDPGMSVLHKDEPTQLVALKLSAIKQVNMYDTKTFRKSSRPLRDDTYNTSIKLTLSELNSMTYEQKYNIIRSPSGKLANLSNLLILVKDKNMEVRNLIAWTENMYPEILEKLANDEHIDVKKAVMFNANTPKNLMLKLMEEFVNGNDNQKNVIARFRKTPTEILKKLENDPLYARALATNTNVSTEFLIKSSKSENQWLRVDVANNTSTPVEVLRELAADEDKIVRKYAQQTLDKLSF